MMLFIHSVSHFLVDALSITILFHEGVDANLLAIAVVLYNTLAFSTQCLVGFLPFLLTEQSHGQKGESQQYNREKTAVHIG